MGVFTLMVLLALTDDPDPQAVLNEAQALTRQGKYEEALQKHLWFHDNALRVNPAMTGVRVSFALSYWVELGKKYPKAREALVAIRDEDMKRLAEGDGSFPLFMDISSIDGYLGEDLKTVEAFLALREKSPKLAEQCYPLVEEKLVTFGVYDVCIQYIPDPNARFLQIKQTREMHLDMAKKMNGPFLQFAEGQFSGQTCRLIEILVRVGRKPDAETIRDKALAVRDDPDIRGAVEKAAQPPKKAGN